MGRLINLVLFGGVLLGAFWLYQVKQQARETEGQIAILQHQIAVEKEALLLLKAEWSYLNRPERVQNLAKRFADQLGLKEVKAYQIGEDADLPERVASRDGAGDAGPETIDELLGKASTRPKPMKQ